MQHTGAIAPRTKGGLLLTAAFACGLLTAACAQSSYQLIKVLDGALGEGALIEGSEGKLYGTIAGGGGKGEGMGFKLNKDGNGYRLLHSFSGQSDQPNWPEGWLEEKPAGKPVDWDGAGPQGLVQARDGELYGTTGNLGKNGQGTAFKLNPDGGGFTILHAFPSFDGDGKNPHGRLIAASDGALYGTTQYNSTNNCATVFKIVIAASVRATAPPSR